MDIRKWGLDQVMMLPDSCFGRRRLIILSGSGKTGAPAFDICETGLSERMVVWGIAGWHLGGALVRGYIEFRLGDNLPVTIAEFRNFEGMFPEMITPALVRNTLCWVATINLPWLPMRRPYITSGRRIVVALTVSGLAAEEVYAAILISSVPTEVPDCLLSV